MSKDNVDIFDHYLTGEMNESERKSFEEMIASDLSMNQEFTKHKMIIEGIAKHGSDSLRKSIMYVDESLDRNGFFSGDEESAIIKSITAVGQDDLKNLIGEVDKNLEKEAFFEEKLSSETKIRKLGGRQIWAIAASFAILLAIWWLIPRSPSGSALFASNFSIPEESVTSQILVEKSEVGFASENATYLDQLESSMLLFGNAEYDQFIRRSEILLTEPSLSHYRDDLLLYRAIALMAMDEFDQAQDELNDIEVSSEESAFYQALLHLQNNRIDEAKLLLKQMTNAQAQDLLRQLN